MPYLIDGHNLIPKLGLDLSSFDDEMALIDRLNEYCRVSRCGQMEIYFDNAQPGGEERKKFGMVQAYFIRRPMIADEAIRQRLAKLKNAAKNWQVVSSDHHVRAEAKAAGARVVTSDEFARMVFQALRNGPAVGPATERMISEREVAEWLDLFEKGKKK